MSQRVRRNKGDAILPAHAGHSCLEGPSQALHAKMRGGRASIYGCGYLNPKECRREGTRLPQPALPPDTHQDAQDDKEDDEDAGDGGPHNGPT